MAATLIGKVGHKIFLAIGRGCDRENLADRNSGEYLAAEKIAAWGKTCGADEYQPNAAHVLIPHLLEKGLTREEIEQASLSELASFIDGPGQSRAGKTRRYKRSAEQGEARAKIVAALTAHHQYENGSCLHCTPIGVRALARKLGDVSAGSVSGFFKREFGGHAKYWAACREPATLAQSLRILNGELTPSILFNKLSGDVKASD